MSDDTDLAARYGPWALIIGASEGIGAAFARSLAAAGIGVVLVARRQAALDEVAAGLGDTAPTRTIATDLTSDDAVPSIVAATADLEVGLLVYCAGGDPNYERFLDRPVDEAVAMVERNCVAPLRLCHHFAAPMQQRGRGGIVVVSSGAALVGGPNMVAYGATKAFDMVMAEALWAELHGDGVDALGLVLGVTDTPALRRTLVRRGQLPDLDTPVDGAATAESVVAEAFANLPHGPTCFATPDVKLGAETLGTMSRNDAARLMLELHGGVMGPDAVS